MRGARQLGVVKRCSPRLSSEVQGTPHLPSPAGLRGHTEHVERRDYPARFSQPYQGQGHHVIMCEWIRRGSPGISVLVSTFTLRNQPALIFLFCVFTGHFSRDSEPPSSWFAKSRSLLGSIFCSRGGYIDKIPKLPKGSVFCYRSSFSGNHGHRIMHSFIKYF